MAQPDILVFMSDQHTARLMSGAGDPIVSTPNMDRLAREGVRFANAYTSCPLCVPARMSLLTGWLPSRLGVLTNGDVLHSGYATLAHSLGSAGYETILCGRMHFCGQDQRHGFERRLVGDFTPCLPGRSGDSRADLGPYVSTPAGKWQKHFGGGTSPVLEYDRAVVAGALENLAEPAERPRLLVTGIYGPHHTFVAPEPLYRKYLDLVDEPIDPDSVEMHPVVREQISKRDLSADAVRRVRAAYYGLVEHVDGQLGRVLEAWDARLARTGRKGLFCYLSDHGEQGGHRGLWGKQTFYDEAARIPLIFRGAGVRAGDTHDTPVSLMDVTPTLCDIVGTEAPPEHDGTSLTAVLAGESAPPDRPILAEVSEGGRLGRMVRRGRWKYIAYHGFEGADMLFDLQADPAETRNVLAEHPDIAEALRADLHADWDPEAVVRRQRLLAKHRRIQSAWGAAVPLPEPDRWPVPQSSWQLPKV